MKELFPGQYIRITTEGPVDILSINRPSHNLLSSELKEQLFSAFSNYRDNNTTRVVIVNSEIPGCFCAGADLKEFPERIRNDQAGDVWDYGHKLFDLPRLQKQVFLSVIDGIALGGGLELALSCDLIVGSSKTKIGLPEVTKGIMPGCGGIEKLYERVGYSTALNMLITGSIIQGKEAKEMGIIDIFCGEKDPLDKAKEIAEEICRQPGLAVAAIKSTLAEYAMDIRTNAGDRGKERFSSLHKSIDCIEAINAFFEKRNPTFSHRE